MECLRTISLRIPLIFPLHPRTRKNLEQFGLFVPGRNVGILYTKPLGYLEFLNLLLDACLVLTDSGGIQEETTFLGVPCITLRNNTERPVTTTVGTNYLVGTNPNKIVETVHSVIEGNTRRGSVPQLWDGEAGARIMEILAKAGTS
jgi:UDP-N-acetylglucosamine 2-epimerase (non-hydrolysing)